MAVQTIGLTKKETTQLKEGIVPKSKFTKPAKKS